MEKALTVKRQGFFCLKNIVWQLLCDVLTFPKQHKDHQ
jgi:hypothetical protein